MQIDAIGAGGSTALREIAQDLAEMRSGQAANPATEGGFASFLEKSVGDVNELLNTADKKSVDLATGKSENIHDALISMEKAETSLKLMLQTRNKALEAYHEILRMQL